MTRCEHKHPTRYDFGRGWLTVQCRQDRGIRSWWDEAGFPHRACPAHYAALALAHPAWDPREPSWDMPVETVVFPDAADYLEGIHQNHSQDPSEGPGLHECPVCMSVTFA